MNTAGKEKLAQLIADFTATTAIFLPDDVEKRLRELASGETIPTAKTMYDCILKNLALATFHCFCLMASSKAILEYFSI